MEAKDTWVMSLSLPSKLEIGYGASLGTFSEKNYK